MHNNETRTKNMLRICVLVDNRRIGEWKEELSGKSIQDQDRTYEKYQNKLLLLLSQLRELVDYSERERADGFLRRRPNTSPPDDDADGNRFCAWRLEINNKNSICFCQKLILTDLQLGS